MKENFSALLGFIFLGLFGYFGYELIIFLTLSFKSIDTNIGAALVAAVTTIISSVYISSYNSRKGKERIAFEAHREKKAEIYNEFMKILIDIMRNTKEGKKESDVLPDNIEEFFYSFTSKIVVYGGPGAVKAYINWRSASSEGSGDQLDLIDNLFREIRKDLGESNSGISKKDLIGLFLKKDLS